MVNVTTRAEETLAQMKASANVRGDVRAPSPARHLKKISCGKSVSTSWPVSVTTIDSLNTTPP